MNERQEWKDALERLLGVAPQSWTPLVGGDINDAHRVRLADGRLVFVKTNAASPAGLFGAEAAGLRWLAEAGAVRIPAVLAVTDKQPAMLVLEYLEPGPRRRDFSARLGQQLAALHGSGAPNWGWFRDNFIGTLPQVNRERPSWPEFFRHERLAAQLRLAVNQQRVNRSLKGRLEALLERLTEFLPELARPHRIHGDLWAGNLHTDEHGAPVLIDPAPYGGHGEVDLAMMHLFGGFESEVFAEYRCCVPAEEGSRERRAIYQLYPLLVHVNLFGSGYLGGVEQRLVQLGF